ncbi:MAG: hypothetical protein A2V88_03850 [Elusimicrobia bacterium RBG_16_66_12]|nr:MAG: hypothetical protein A2V88_03850 [Elusimicrobia bacterium RBG_16_66_12]
MAVALKYVGLPYLHRHIPAMGGLDCSNFTAWVYNYGFGIRLNSNVQRQAETAGRRLGPDEPLRPGDLIFLWNDERSRVSHVAIYVDESTIIDAAGGGVAVRPFSGRYRKRLAWARRVF